MTRMLPDDWEPAGDLFTIQTDPWDTAYSLWMVAAVLFAFAVAFGGEYLIGTR